MRTAGLATLYVFCFVGRLLGVILGVGLMLGAIIGIGVVPSILVATAVAYAIDVRLVVQGAFVVSLGVCIIAGLGFLQEHGGLDELREQIIGFSRWQAERRERLDETRATRRRRFWQRKSRTYRGGVLDYPDNWDELRHAVYARDAYECTNCGAADVALHAHHVVPLSVGGSNAMSNLTTLCFDCHARLHPHMRE